MTEKVYTTPLPAKLGIKEGSRAALVDAPEDAEGLLSPLPKDVRLMRTARGPLDVIVVFSNRLKHLRSRFAKLAAALDPAGGLWVCYPKKSSGVQTDLTFQNVQAHGLEAGLVDNKSIAWDETWSAVRFVYRLEDRPAR
ncbi:MAG: DUF3052 domain-containing protein [Actinobacteria bacterium]|nr:DUF3052 domain-containing protein [Actinomycetota bacterium]